MVTCSAKYERRKAVPKKSTTTPMKTIALPPVNHVHKRFRAGGCGGAEESLVSPVARCALLALALEIEERVVDSDGHADEQDHGHRGVGCRYQVAEQARDPECGDDAGEGEQDRQACGDKGAEGEQHDQ